MHQNAELLQHAYVKPDLAVDLVDAVERATTAGPHSPPFSPSHHHQPHPLLPSQDSAELLQRVYAKPDLATDLVDAVERATTAAAEAVLPGQKRKRGRETGEDGLHVAVDGEGGTPAPPSSSRRGADCVGGTPAP
jgi:hypothetical protein